MLTVDGRRSNAGNTAKKPASTEAGFVCLFAEVQRIQDLAGVGDNSQHAAGVVALVVPVTGSDLNSDLLAGISLQPTVLVGGGAIQTDIPCSHCQLEPICTHQLNLL